MSEDITRAFPASIAYGTLQETHKEYDAKYWKDCRCLYSGGRDLLKDYHLLRRLFPRNPNEREDIYQERIKRAFYISYPGEILDHIVASLSTRPVQVASVEDNEDEFYEVFFDDVSSGGGKRLSLNYLVKKQILTALLCKRAWTLVDFPSMSSIQHEIITEADQRAAGALNAYALCLDPELVFDWEVSPDGELLWVKVCVEKREKSFDGLSDQITKEYTVYRPNDWGRYAITYEADKPPKDEVEVPLVEQGPHSFGRVPLLKLELPDGLWAMNKLESLAREYFNKRNQIAWAETRSLFPERYEFEQPEDTGCVESEISEDTGRFNNQVRGIGYTQIRAAGDRVEFVGPSPDPFRYALESLKDLRDEMHRVTHQMALSFDNSASALRRSGDSKFEDKRDSSIVLNALGGFARDHVTDIYVTISNGRGDMLTWIVGGMSNFEDVELVRVVEEGIRLDTFGIPSKTFHKHFKFQVAEAALKDQVPLKVIEQVREEIETNIENSDIDELPKNLAQTQLKTVAEQNKPNEEQK